MEMSTLRHSSLFNGEPDLCVFMLQKINDGCLAGLSQLSRNVTVTGAILCFLLHKPANRNNSSAPVTKRDKADINHRHAGSNLGPMKIEAVLPA